LQRLDHRVVPDRRRELDALGLSIELLLEDRRALLGLLQVVLGVDGVVLGFGEAPAVGVDLRRGGGQRRLVPKRPERLFRFLEARGNLVALLLEEPGDSGVARMCTYVSRYWSRRALTISAPLTGRCSGSGRR
jgi:hypothetical protein